MKTSDLKQQFLTSLKNGKIGIFRPQTEISELKAILSVKVELIDTDYGGVWLGDNIEIFFEKGFLSRVRFKFYEYQKSGEWLEVINLSWLDYLSELSFWDTKEVLVEAGSKFKSIEYDNGELAILSSTPHAQLMIFFYEDGKLDQAHLEFDLRFRLFNDIKEFTGYPR